VTQQHRLVLLLPWQRILRFSTAILDKLKKRGGKVNDEGLDSSPGNYAAERSVCA